MIAVTRCTCPRSLDGDGSPGEDERQSAVAFFAEEANREEPFDFRAYKEPDIQAALSEMFGPKCAYCESDIRSVAPPDAEHFRPKGEINVAGQRRRPGYYWLASDWHNLLPACYDCNRPRYQETARGRRLSGKGNHFPLEDEARRASAPGEEELEQPYLLDPCRDDPEAHLEFLPEGAIRAAIDATGAPSQRGKVTIETLGLDRVELANARREQAIVVRRAIVHFRQASQRLDRNPEDPDAQAELEDEIAELRRLSHDRSRFAALARQMIAKELQDFGIPDP